MRKVLCRDNRSCRSHRSRISEPLIEIAAWTDPADEEQNDDGWNHHYGGTDSNRNSVALRRIFRRNLEVFEKTVILCFNGNFFLWIRAAVSLITGPTAELRSPPITDYRVCLIHAASLKADYSRE